MIADRCVASHISSRSNGHEVAQHRVMSKETSAIENGVLSDPGGRAGISWQNLRPSVPPGTAAQDCS